MTVDWFLDLLLGSTVAWLVGQILLTIGIS